MEIGGELISQTEIKTVDKTIKERFVQDKTERFVEYMTGLKFDDPELAKRLSEDQKVIRAKYGLPDRKYQFENTSEYENYLRELAKVNGVNIREKTDCGIFFEKYDYASGVYSENDKLIGINIDKSEKETYIKSMGILEHEVIHSLQHKYSPGMNIELREYEAYLAGWNTSHFLNNPDTLPLAFNYFMIGSVNHWYREKSEERGEIVKPEWDNPEYFLLNVDGINDKQIQDYKNKEQVVDVQK